MKTIEFYRAADQYGEFSNFAPYPIYLDGKHWPTSEPYFQAQKFAGTEHEEAVRNAKSPMIAARIGRDRARGLRSDWEQVKDSVMLRAVRTKFDQHPRLASLLLSTGEAPICEHTSRDSYWGDGGDGTGRNTLGKILMQVRGELRETRQKKT
ncbi:MAG TPA: NADAR family protein [Blastocatellia bacterium]|nr:NADAR family protein [Blastocatellia bacterium]